MRSRPLLGPALAGLVLALVGCASAQPSSDGTITVFAAASLRSSFTELAESFEEAHPGTRVVLSFAGSSDLAAQLVNGAPADVFASADERTMATVTEAGLVEGEPAGFATNTLQIAVPPANPAGVSSFADLARPGTTTVVCAPQVPCGAATLALARAVGVDLSPVSEESSVTDVLGKVSSGEADAGVVYTTDVLAAGGSVTGIAIPEAEQAPSTYSIAALDGSTDPEAAAAFAASVASPAGRAVLADAGFGAP